MLLAWMGWAGDAVQPCAQAGPPKRVTCPLSAVQEGGLVGETVLRHPNNGTFCWP